MGWPPAAVLQVTAHDLVAAFRGWQRSRGIDPDDPTRRPGAPRRMTRERLAELQAYARDQERKRAAQAGAGGDR